jgi:hypothetical protein
MAQTDTTSAATHSDHTYAIAERIRGIASDSLYTFTPGLQQLNIDTFPEHLHLVARFSTHDWGISSQIWARDKQGVLQASAEASAGPIDEASSIHTHIKHFRSGPLLWTRIGEPVSLAAISALGAARPTYTAVGRHCYRLHPQPRTDLDAHPVWQLDTDDLDIEHPLFAGVTSAVTYIAETFEQPPTPSRRRQPAPQHPWKR